MATGGSLQQISYAGRIFAIAADADVNYDLGGFSSESQPNGNATSRTIMTRKNWKVEGVNVVIDDDQDDLGFLQDKADSPEDDVFTMTMVNDVTYRGKGRITGDIKASTQNKIATLIFEGPGKLEQQ